MSAWQVPALMHVRSIVTANPLYQRDFEATVSYLALQISDLQTMNGPNNRNIAAIETGIEEGMADMQIASFETGVTKKQNKFRSKKSQGKKDWKGKGNHKRAGGKVNHKIQYDPKNPSKYLPRKVFMALDKDICDHVIASREKKRGLSALTIHRIPPAAKRPDPNDDDMDCSDDEVTVLTTNKPTAKLAPMVVSRVPKTSLVAPKVKQLKTTQRDATYASRPSHAIKQEEDDPNDF